MQGRDGELARNVHFVPRWQAGTSIFASYAPGRELLGEVVGRHTVHALESARISLWADELSRESIDYAYVGPERDSDVARYCKDMQLFASYRPFAKGLLWNTERGLVVRLQGLPFVVKPKVTAYFRKGDTELPISWDFDRWDEGESKTLDTAGKLAWEPEGYRVVVSFPLTDYAWQGTWPTR